MYPDDLGTKCHKKSRAWAHFKKKIMNIQADTLWMKKWKNGSLLLLVNQCEEK